MTTGCTAERQMGREGVQAEKFTFNIVKTMALPKKTQRLAPFSCLQFAHTVVLYGVKI